MRVQGKGFTAHFKELCQRSERWTIWYDFLEMTAIAISNSVDSNHFEQREKQFNKIRARYTDKEYRHFQMMASEMVQDLEERPDQDYLGTMYMELELNDKDHGQVFTPYSLCRMCADHTVMHADEVIAQKGYCTVYDPTVGAGALLIAARNKLNDMGYGSDQAYFVGQELMHSTAHMAYVQLSLLGCAGVIACGNTLSHPLCFHGLVPIETEDISVWIMPATYSKAWADRFALQRMRDIMDLFSVRGDPKPEQEQLTLF